MSKNIVVCLDGTGNQLKATANTNVVRLYGMLDLTDPSRQVAYYDPGVGTMGARGAWSTWGRKLTRLFGLAFGSGIKDNLEESLNYLIDNYEPGDRVFIFGFSRGAFTARGLVGMTNRSGVMRRGTENLAPYLVAAYTKGKSFSNDDWRTLDLFAETFSVKTDKSLAMPVHFLGLWDSVKALGILRPDPKWPYTRPVAQRPPHLSCGVDRRAKAPLPRVPDRAHEGTRQPGDLVRRGPFRYRRRVRRRPRAGADHPKVDNRSPRSTTGCSSPRAPIPRTAR